MTSELDPKQARSNWIGWINWYMSTHKREIPTKVELAKRLGYAGKSGVAPILDPHGTTTPSFDTLVRSTNMTGVNLDAMLRSSPPAVESSATRTTELGPPHPRKR